MPIPTAFLMSLYNTLHMISVFGFLFHEETFDLDKTTVYGYLLFAQETLYGRMFLP